MIQLFICLLLLLLIAAEMAFQFAYCTSCAKFFEKIPGKKWTISKDWYNADVIPDFVCPDCKIKAIPTRFIVNRST